MKRPSASWLKVGLMVVSSLSGMVMTGCVSSGGGAYLPAWYDVYGNACSSGTPSPGCNFYYDGYKITAAEDPYSAGAYYSYGQWDYVDSYGYYQTYYGWGWQSPDGVIYADNGSALNSDGDSDSRDIIDNQAEIEKKVVIAAGKDLASKYALAEDKGIKIATTLNDWATLSKKQKRARTDKDVADFSMRLYGISADKAKTAIDQAQAGNTAGLDAANSDVAKFWGTSPETSKRILKTWYKNELSEVGLSQ